eukprot:c43197_g1_i1 orf=142-975(+)
MSAACRCIRTFPILCCGSRPSSAFRSVAGRQFQRAFAMSSEGADLKKIQIGSGNSAFDAYTIGKQGAPGVIVLQEWWGVDFEVKNHAIEIAKRGFYSLIPDLYHGKVGLDVAEAQHLMDNLNWTGAIGDVAESVKWLKEKGCPKVGVTGYCMGGALSLASAVLVPGVDAVVAFYGTPSPELADLSKVKIPVQAHFGELDNINGFSDLAAARSLEENLKMAGVDHEVHIYQNNGHAFMNSSPDAIKRNEACGFAKHDQAAVDLAWSRFDAWFNKHLKY